MKYYDYVILISGKTFSRDFLLSWSSTLEYLFSSKKTVSWAVVYTPIVSDTRNLLVGFGSSNIPNFSMSKKVFNDEIECNKVIFLDDDIAWDVTSFKRLIESDKDAISGAYLTLDFKTVAASIGEQPIDVSYLNSKKEPFEITGVGLGFFCCSFKVLKEISYPWFFVTLNEEGYTIPEDNFFVHRIRELGYKVFLDPQIRVSHIKTLPLMIPPQDRTTV